VTPPLGLLYVGWNEPGEWFNLTVETATAGTFVADVLYTSQRGGTVGIDVNGTAAGAPFVLASTFDPAETIPWRQWHHWNVARDAFVVNLPKGVSVLTVHIVTNGNLNLATFELRPAGSPRTGPGITAVKTPSPAPTPDKRK
jgi:phosphoribosylcarboxyaminoimidazole (NCAIR) mutase